MEIELKEIHIKKDISPPAPENIHAQIKTYQTQKKYQ